MAIVGLLLLFGYYFFLNIAPSSVWLHAGSGSENIHTGIHRFCPPKFHRISSAFLVIIISGGLKPQLNHHKQGHAFARGPFPCALLLVLSCHGMCSYYFYRLLHPIFL